MYICIHTHTHTHTHTHGMANVCDYQAYTLPSSVTQIVCSAAHLLSCQYSYFCTIKNKSTESTQRSRLPQRAPAAHATSTTLLPSWHAAPQVSVFVLLYY